MFVACPGCAARLDIPDDKAGNPRTKVMCPGCQRIFRMEEAAKANPPTGPMPAPRLPPPVMFAPTGPVPAPQLPPSFRPAPLPAGLPPAAPPPPVTPPPAAAVPPRPAPMPLGADAAIHNDHLVELDGFGMGLDEISTPDDGARFEVDRLDYQGTTVSLDEVRDLLKRGWLHRSDRIRAAGSDTWSDVGKHPGLAQALAVRQKAIAQKLALMARKSSHPCENHLKKKATHICLECARAFCKDCGNDSDGVGTPLCLDCDAKMAPVS